MIFEAVESVLTDLDDAGQEEHGGAWDGLVQAAVLALAGSYKELTEANRTLIDYSALSTQAAYVFMYAGGHADFTCQILERARQEVGQPLFPSGTLRVSSMGGGPASELLGLLKYLSMPGYGESVSGIVYTVLDKEGGWQHVAEAMVDAAGTNIPVDFEFIRMDVSDTSSCESITLEDDHLVFMSFFVSEVCTTNSSTSVKRCIEHLLATVSDESFVFYNDSGSYPFYSFFNYRKRAAGNFVELYEFKGDISVDSSYEFGVIEDYMARHGRTPKVNSFALAKLCQRQFP